jgi:hypothetical protein
MGIADELITRGWTQEALEDEKGRVCLAGAIECHTLGRIVLGEWPKGMDDRFQRAAHVVREIIRDVSITDWNDTVGRTFDEVLRVATQADEILGAS